MTTYDPGQAVDELMIATSLLNQKLAEIGWPLVPVPQRVAPIQPFFDGMIELINRIQVVLADEQ